MARDQLVHASSLTRWGDTRLLQMRERHDFWVGCAHNVTGKVQKYQKRRFGGCLQADIGESFAKPLVVQHHSIIL